jgi:hypothetical protein
MTATTSFTGKAAMTSGNGDSKVLIYQKLTHPIFVFFNLDFVQKEFYFFAL